MGLQLLGKEIFEAGIQQAKTLSIPINNEEVLSIFQDNIFTVVTNKEKYEAKSILLATGANRIAPNIKGIKEFEGKGISYCAVCDGFLYRGQDVAVLGSGEYALHEAKELSNLAKSVTILTNGKNDTRIAKSEKITINEKKIIQFDGDSIIRKVKFEDKTELKIRGIFIAEGIATSIDFARKLGAKSSQNKIIVNSKMETNVAGLYAAGDCTGGLLQISTAVAEGAIAGTEIIKFIRESNEGK